ncbi:MAG: Na+/H+ antiporter NhaA [Bdellovibrionota bacterium]
MSVRQLTDFFKLESSGGILLFLAATLAILFVNSPLNYLYQAFIATDVQVSVGTFILKKPALHWINDGLMAVFFFLIGLEIKREVLAGDFRELSKMVLPLIAALAGVLCPAVIFLMLTSSDPVLEKGWAIPAATDIAFALGVLSLFGSRVPISLKLFLTAVAIIDDILAIVIIAFFYTSNLSWLSLGLAAVCIFILFLINKRGVQALTPYVLLGIVLWVCVLKSGVHATLAGVVLASAIPFNSPETEDSPLEFMEHALHPWVAFLVLPLFGFANAGVSFAEVSFVQLFSPLTLGIFFGLLIGKQLGVFLFSSLVIRMGFADMPPGMNYKTLYGCSALTGIGFTMSLFVGTLAYSNPELIQLTKIGVIAGSLASGILGYLVLSKSLAKN